jgi:hypothetical protein
MSKSNFSSQAFILLLSLVAATPAYAKESSPVWDSLTDSVGNLLNGITFGAIGKGAYLNGAALPALDVSQKNNGAPDGEGNYKYEAKIRNTQASPLSCWGFAYFSVSLKERTVTLNSGLPQDVLRKTGTSSSKWYADIQPGASATVQISVPFHDLREGESVNSIIHNAEGDQVHCKAVPTLASRESDARTKELDERSATRELMSSGISSRAL